MMKLMVERIGEIGLLVYAVWFIFTHRSGGRKPPFFPLPSTDTELLTRKKRRLIPDIR